jgi:hypothetical protein
LELGIFGEVVAKSGVGGVGRGLIKAEIAKGVGVVSKEASSSELAGGAEGIKDIPLTGAFTFLLLSNRLWNCGRV